MHLFVSFLSLVINIADELAGVMAVDMYMRLLRRVSNDTKSKTQ